MDISDILIYGIIIFFVIIPLFKEPIIDLIVDFKQAIVSAEKPIEPETPKAPEVEKTPIVETKEIEETSNTISDYERIKLENEILILKERLKQQQNNETE